MSARKRRPKRETHPRERPAEVVRTEPAHEVQREAGAAIVERENAAALLLLLAPR